MTHDPLCPMWSKVSAGDVCDCDLIAKVRQDEREQTWERAADAVYETTDGLAALKIQWSIDPESRPHEIGWRCYKAGTVEVCQRCGEKWPCSAIQKKP